MKSRLQEIIQDVTADESDFILWGEQTRKAVTAIVHEGPRFMAALVDNAFKDDHLRTKCETHQLLDYIVLHDNPQNGLRVRLHISTHDHLQRVHDHRFSFSSHILNGKYDHCIYEPKFDLYQRTPEKIALAFQDKQHTDPNFQGLSMDELFKLRLLRAETRGACYTMHHSVSHTVFTTRGTVSLVLRGAPHKKRSFIYDREDGSLWWRFGRENETTQRIGTKIMSAEKIMDAVGNLRQLGVLQ